VNKKLKTASYFAIYPLLLLCAIAVEAQQEYILSGRVTGHHKEPLQGATVYLDQLEKGVITDKTGNFRIGNVPGGLHVINIMYVGYHNNTDSVYIDSDVHKNFAMEPSYVNLQEVEITDDHIHRQLTENPLSAEIVNEVFVGEYLQGHLAKTLERLPGVSAMSIGSGQAKPVIRGLGFNRVVVTENGIKHEGQQWGADHGLEIDQFAADRIEVVKGPSSLLYGSDAIGGVINLENLKVPELNTVRGDVAFTGMSNNQLLGTSAQLDLRGESLLLGMRATYMDYADFSVPADSVDVYSFRVPLHKRHVRNTAGYERNFHINAGYMKHDFSARIFLSRIESKNGFFANAHGLEPRNVDMALHDRSSRDILYPHQEATHWKAVGRFSLRKTNYALEADIGYQDNRRMEFSEYTSHGFMPPGFPDTVLFASDLERAFSKQSLDANLRAKWAFNDSGEIVSGISASTRRNTIDGRGFIIPAYNERSTGAFIYGKYHLSGSGILHAGARIDRGSIHTEPYYDWFSSPAGTQGSQQEIFLQRAEDLDRQFSSLSWSIGYNHNSDRMHLKTNAGKSFRMPIAKELAANGVNYHFYRFEVGNPDLKPEEAYQMDVGLEWQSYGLSVGATPFVNYFTNYIYLNPGFEHDRLYGNGNQVYTYTQAEVLRYGGEVHSHYLPTDFLRLGLIAEYVYAVQLSGEKKGFSLPFSPPPAVLLNVKYMNDRLWKVGDFYVNMDVKKVFRQERIVPPEEVTDGYFLVNVGVGGELETQKRSVRLSLKVNNLLNSVYLNHTSYYRLINMPGPGRNITLHVVVPFSGDLNK